MSWDLMICMYLQRRCDTLPPGAPQEDVTLLLSCFLSFISFLSVSTSVSVLSLF